MNLNLFKSARLKLTGWYLLIIMCISISFSVGMYRLLSGEVDRFARMQGARMEKRITDSLIVIDPDNFRKFRVNYEIDLDVINEAKERIFWTLTLVNVFILVISGILGYFLAGKTLKPIKEMLDEQNRFITDASHELRTPLTALKSSMEVYLRDKKPQLTDANILIKESLDEVNNMQELSDNLLMLSQYQKLEDTIKFDQVSFSEVIATALLKVKRAASNKKIKVVNNSKEFYVNGNKYMLTDLVVILLDNAIKYSQQNSAIVIDSKITDKSKSFSISDSGMGINKKDLDHIFDRFYRADEARTRSEISGYGLGLSIAKKIVDVHCASINVESHTKTVDSNNSGTKFVITFN